MVRELLAGPRRYTDLHADLPGVSTDVLASRLRDMEQSGIAVRRRAARNGTARVYELTQRGRELLPVLSALGEWGAEAMEERRPTDAVRAHWLALPLRTALERCLGGALAAEAGAVGAVETVEVRTPEGTFHLRFHLRSHLRSHLGPDGDAGPGRSGGAGHPETGAGLGCTGHESHGGASELAGAAGAADPGSGGFSGAPPGSSELAGGTAATDAAASSDREAAVEISQAPGIPAAHLSAGYRHGSAVYGEGPAENADLWLELETGTATAIAGGRLQLVRAVADGSVRFGGVGATARLLRESVAGQRESPAPPAAVED